MAEKKRLMTVTGKKGRRTVKQLRFAADALRDLFIGKMPILLCKFRINPT